VVNSWPLGSLRNDDRTRRWHCRTARPVETGTKEKHNVTSPAPSHFDDNWIKVDESADPAFFIQFLDQSRAGARAAAQADPAGFFAYLGVQPGHRVLEIGCGAGDFTRILASLVSSGGVVGLDYSRVMVEEARRRDQSSGVPVEFVQGDVHNLEFEDSVFDVVFARIVLQHLPDPARAIAEMARVVRPGGLVAADEQDWDTLIVDAEDRHTTRQVLETFSDGVRNNWIGRQLARLFRDAGLEDLALSAHAQLIPATTSLSLDHTARRAVEQGRITDEQRELWLADLRRRSQNGDFFAAFTVFRAAGRKSLSG
jgi:ubiquinone/menaquinone biosynthesis C-methylase UbiE